MSFRTPPPDLPMCSRHDLRRQQRRILFRVPLRKQIRKFCRQRVFLRQNDAASADGTARSPRADSDFGTVGMALGASPPYLLMAGTSFGVSGALRSSSHCASRRACSCPAQKSYRDGWIAAHLPQNTCPPAIQAEGSFIAHCVSGTVDKNVQVADHSDIHKICTLTIALL